MQMFFPLMKSQITVKQDKLKLGPKLLESHIKRKFQQY